MHYGLRSFYFYSQLLKSIYAKNACFQIKLFALLVPSADNLLQTAQIQIKILSGLIWIQTVWHWYGIYSLKCWFWKKISRHKRHEKLPGSRHRVPTSSENHGKPGKSLKKCHVWKNHGIRKNLNNHGKIMEFDKTWIIMEKSWNFVK